MSRARALDSATPSAGQRLALATCLVAIGLPHLFHLPIWVGATAGAIVAWQALAAWRDRPLPPRWLRFVLAVLAFGLVFAAFGRVNGQQAGVSLLLLLLALKLCELRSHRDAMVFVSLLCFLLITQFLFSQSLIMAVYLVLGLWLAIAAFVGVGSGARLRDALSDSARLALQAVPIAALLFVLFPRIPGPIWGLPADAGASASTGLSDSMSPGSITDLALSPGVALRARFDGEPPPAQQRYWRGPVLWDFAQGTWRMGQADARLPGTTVRAARAALHDVEITLEATRHHWLIALDVPVASDRDARQGASATLVADDAIDSRTQYRVRSASRYVLDPTLPDATRRRALRLPANGNPRARALAERWRENASDPAAVVQAALAMFRKQPFRYTLAPAATRREASIDDFLFDTREGFCEHYAGAFTFLMRAAGVPARVVTGYQGGERGVAGDYWIVRNADAHAWSEVWLAGRGWVRVDPTAAVAPSRIEAGVSASLEDNANLPYMARAGGHAWYRVQMLWDAVNAGWNRWFLAYGPQLQQRVLAALGLRGFDQAILALTAGVIALLAAVSLWLGWRMRAARHPDPAVRAWQTVCARLARIGIERAPQDTPHALARRVARLRPDLASQMVTLADLYAELRYAPHPDDALRERFLARARAFRPPRRRPRASRAPLRHG